MAPPRKALLDALAVSPHPLEVERQRVATETHQEAHDRLVMEAWLDDDWDDPDDPWTWRRVWAWLRGWWR